MASRPILIFSFLHPLPLPPPPPPPLPLMPLLLSPHLHVERAKLIQTTFRWLNIPRGDGSQKILGGHVDLRLRPLVFQPDGGKVTEDLIRSTVGSDTILVFYDTTIVETHTLLLLFLSCTLGDKQQQQQQQQQ